MRYVIFFEDEEIFRTDSITEDDDVTFLEGLIDIVDTKYMTKLCDDLSWEPIDEWKH